MTEFYRQYLAVAVFVLAALLMVARCSASGGCCARRCPRTRSTSPTSRAPTRCASFGQANVRYYIYALLFVVFDVEAVFIFPWAVGAESLAWFGLIEMAVFVAVLLLGLGYVWRKGLLKWA